MNNHKTTTELVKEGYAAITDAYESYEEALFQKTFEQMTGTDFVVGLDRLGRKVIMRRKGEVK